MANHLKTFVRHCIILGLAATPVAAAQANDRLEDRVNRLERIVNSGAMADMVNQMEQLQRELRLVRGDLEVVQYELEELKQRQRDLFQDNDRRLRELETAARTPSTPATGTVPVPNLLDGENGVTAADPEREWDAYQEAFSILRAGRYDEAAEAFVSFLEHYPEGRFAGNALYWLGESYYVVRDFDNALPHFQRIVDELPNNDKQPDAKLKIGFIYHEQNNLEQARETLEAVRRQYPDTTAATLAEQRLQRIRRDES
ncbi:tol-pal system protein YbgF [Alkalilimnicola ehrlichii]|uniref:Cell division coordinator CpoB n=1 Tax=Alkalilimnicola ehrlichii TaxID=351052 RepID=A0A3E0X3G5_9GAMM|nr:tol-pal system protein YbgF [Alkalilimnicola ehrlichii]RFA31343.1 tol-pal system protein YbgF [Alkalilimnicola ehrlichii]RFA39382.1 tol-pal system protein YbgF [Alkalilimnicola ehrlichii]